MANLLETIRNNSQQMAQAPGTQDQTQQLGTLLRAKTGKAGLAPGVVSSNLGEQQAVVQTQQEFQNQIQPQAQIQQAGLQAQQTGQEQAARQQMQDIGQQRKFDTIQSKMKTDALLNDLERNRGKLSMDQYAANVEQLGFNLRLQNDKYLNELQNEGQKARLNNDINFKEQLARTTFDNTQDIFEQRLRDKSILDANDKEYSNVVAQMGIDDAYAMFRAQAESQRQAEYYSNLGNLATTSIGAYGTYSDYSDKKDYYTTGGGKNIESYEASKYRTK